MHLIIAAFSFYLFLSMLIDFRYRLYSIKNRIAYLDQLSLSPENINDTVRVLHSRRYFDINEYSPWSLRLFLHIWLLLDVNFNSFLYFRRNLLFGFVFQAWAFVVRDYNGILKGWGFLRGFFIHTATLGITIWGIVKYKRGILLLWVRGVATRIGVLTRSFL